MEFNAADIFEGVVDRVPEREAVVYGSTRLTYKELDARSNKAANALKKLGIKKGSHIGIYAFNCIEWLEIMLGAYKLCAIPININYRYVEEELKYLIDNADIEAIFYQKQFSTKLNNIKNDLPLLKDFVCMSDGTDSGDIVENSIDFEGLIANESESRLTVERSGDDHYILYTGGTTGMPKGVVWRMEDVLMTLGGGIDAVTGEKYPTPEAFADKCLQDQTVALALAPFMHGGAQWQSFNSFFSGWKLVINDQASFDADYIWEIVAKEKVMNLTIMGDAMGRPLCDALPGALKKGLDLSSLFVFSSTASVFSPSIKDTILEYLPNLFLIDAVGSSETGATGVNIHTKDGKLKGILVMFDEGTYEYPPLNLTKTEFDEWYDNLLNNSKKTWIQNIYWYLETFSNVLVLRNKKWYKSVLPKLIKVWETIIYEKQNGYQHRKSSSRKKKKILKLDDDEKRNIKTLLNNLPDSPVVNNDKIIIKVRTQSFDNK